MRFLSVLAISEMQKASFRMRTQFIDYISSDYNRYSTRDSSEYEEYCKSTILVFEKNILFKSHWD